MDRIIALPVVLSDDGETCYVHAKVVGTPCVSFGFTVTEAVEGARREVVARIQQGFQPPHIPVSPDWPHRIVLGLIA